MQHKRSEAGDIPVPQPRRRGSNLRTLAELGRISNLPTIITNVLAAAALAAAAANGGAALQPAGGAAFHAAGRTAAAILAIALLYLSGMILNDVIDAPIDAQRRASRPIPAGRIRRPLALWLAIISLSAGIAIAAAVSLSAGIAALALCAAIIAYNLLHHRYSCAVLFMGLCRGLVYFVAAAAVIGAEAITTEPIWWAAAAVAIYTIGLTLVARHEHRSVRTLWGWAAIALPIFPLITAVGIGIAAPLLTIFAALLLIVWCGYATYNALRKPPKTQSAVAAWIAGFCLIDAYLLALIDRPWLMTIAIALWALTVQAQRSIKGT